jgi:chromosome segregation ATPase
MKRKQDFLKNQIDQLKYEINAKENAHNDVTKAINKMQKEKDDLKAFIAQMKDRYSKSEEQLKDHEKEIARQQTSIREAEAERKKQKNALDQVVTERDILVRQLFRRNDELSLVYEKIKLQQATMSKGELQYKQRLEDLRVLKLEIRKQQREKQILKNTLSNADELRREIFNTQKELLKERTKCRALAEELENPLNIHRWRRLEGSDPASFELIQKVQALQKRLIEKNEEVVTTDMIIQEKEKMYVELREILARQPGPEVVEQLAEFKNALRHKTKQLKRLAAEINMSESQQEQQEMEIHKIARELQEIKQKYLSAKKREHARREAEMDHRQQTRDVLVDRPVITGGGFHLKNTVTT